jgi:hypothetical protein
MVTNASPEILAMRFADGTLPAAAWPGLAPLFYYDAQWNLLCPKCANRNDEFSEPLIACDTNEEDKTLVCFHCQAKIPTAYGEEKPNEPANC